LLEELGQAALTYHEAHLAGEVDAITVEARDVCIAELTTIISS